MDGDSKPAPSDGTAMSAEERRVRVELAAVYRLVDHYGWSDLIYNHAAARVPGEPSKFLIKTHDCLYTEVTASNLVKVDMHDDLDERHGVNRPGFTLHSGVMMARPDVNCSIHIHTEIGGAISALPSGLRMLSLSATQFYESIGYHDFHGVAETFDERDRLVRDLSDNRALILRHHGLLTVGAHCSQAIGSMRRLMSAAEIQLRMEATGQDLTEIPPEICESMRLASDDGERRRGPADMPAYLRLLDRIDPSYRD